jgi:hypothetical protein
VAVGRSSHLITSVFSLEHEELKMNGSGGTKMARGGNVRWCSG